MVYAKVKVKQKDVLYVTDFREVAELLSSQQRRSPFSACTTFPRACQDGAPDPRHRGLPRLLGLGFHLQQRRRRAAGQRPEQQRERSRRSWVSGPPARCRHTLACARRRCEAAHRLTLRSPAFFSCSQGAAHAAGCHRDGCAEEASEQDEDAAAQGQRAHHATGCLAPSSATRCASRLPSRAQTQRLVLFVCVCSGLPRPSVRRRWL